MLLLRGRPTARRPTPTTAACWAAAMMALALRGLGACRAFQFSAPQARSRPAANALMLLSSSSSNGHGNKHDRAASDAVPTTLTRACYTSGSVASVARSNVLLAASTTTDAETADASASSNDSNSGSASLLGIDWVRGCVAKVLNDAFDPAEVARGAARSKLEPKKKKKKKKKKQQEDEHAAKQEEPPPMSEEEKEAILAAAAAAAQPFTDIDAAVTAATKSEFGDYQCNAAMALAKNVGLAPRDCAAQIVDGLRPLISHCMEEPEIAGPGFINLKFREDYLARAVREMAAEAGPGGRLAVPPVA